MSISACSNYLIPIPGTGFNVVNVPGPNSKGYTNITDQLLYEIWQTLLLILAGSTPPGMVIPVLFTIGDGKSGTPTAGDTSYRNPLLVNKQLLVMRNGIQLQYSDGVTPLQIVRFNDGTDGGWDFDALSGLSFKDLDDYQIFPIGLNTTIEP